MIIRVFKDRVMQGLLVAIVLSVMIGSVFYYFVEDWSVLDSVYF